MAAEQMLADAVKTGDMSTIHQGCDFIGINYYTPFYLKADFGGLPLSAEPPTTAPCAKESNEDAGGADGGPVWLVCPSMLDPTGGAIAPDAFLDTVRRADGSPLDPRITAAFDCLQKTGQFCHQ